MAGNPTPEPQLQLSNSVETTIARGTTTKICFTLKNTGSTEVKDLRMSFHSRVDVKSTPISPASTTLQPGQSIDVCYQVQAPTAVNLSCECDRIAYGHFSALYQRNAQPHLAHQWIKLKLE